MADNKKRFEELIGESVNSEKKPLYSEDFITDKEVLKTINESKSQEEQGKKVLSEQKETAENDVDQFLAESKKGDSKILSESKKSEDDEVFIINLNESKEKDA